MPSIGSLGQLYGVRGQEVSVQGTTIQSPAAQYSVEPRAGIAQVPDYAVTQPASGNIAPAISWVAVLAVLVLIRVLHERGATLE